MKIFNWNWITCLFLDLGVWDCVIGEIGKSGGNGGRRSGWGRMGLIPGRKWRVGAPAGVGKSGTAGAAAAGLGKKAMKAWCNSWKAVGGLGWRMSEKENATSFWSSSNFNEARHDKAFSAAAEADADAAE